MTLLNDAYEVIVGGPGNGRVARAVHIGGTGERVWPPDEEGSGGAARAVFGSLQSRATGTFTRPDTGGDADLIVDLTYDDWPLGIVQGSTLDARVDNPARGVNATWGSDPAGSGVGTNRLTIVADPVRPGGRRMCYYTATGGGNNSSTGIPTGATWRIRFPSERIAQVEYRLRFNSTFDWRDGGKMPGLSGGSNPGGGDFLLTGYSARFMWGGADANDRGSIIVYFYHPEQNKQPANGFTQGSCYGDGVVIPTVLGGRTPFRMAKERDYIIRQRVTMNTPGVRDGKLQVWIDNVLLLDRPSMFRRSGYTYMTDNVYNNVFHGGNNDSFASRTESRLYVDDQKIWRLG